MSIQLYYLKAYKSIFEYLKPYGIKLGNSKFFQICVLDKSQRKS